MVTSMQRIYTILFLIIISFKITAQVSQIEIPRINLMPSEPSPFNMRDWKNVAKKYDAFVFDENKSGTHLPLIAHSVGSINYPTLPLFKLHTYVGTNSPNGNEAINTMPAIVGSSLVGIDNRNKNGKDYVAMTQHFYNKANQENIYLNSVGGNSGSDWWYDVMPNVYFYQLYDLYPGYRGEASLQFLSIANQFLSATKAMGGSGTPWKIPNMNYRAWNFKTMQGNTTSVPEPESAGSFAWLMYHAYKETKNKEFLKGAEWTMEYLNQLTSNPSYELQLPYGIYTAAKMNAEIGTNYNIEKMVNWSFNRGPLRGWGTIVGKWGGFDVSGLVGEANDGGNDYAFQLNGVQQAAALVPMLRYDKRFANAIGKWVLNLANATRLYYPGFLPASMQDANTWTSQYDPESVMGYEALREKQQNLSPFSTGDAVKGGWAKTNISLYSTSSIGYLACLIEKTSDEKILQLNLTATDFFNDASYPTFLYYNPYPTDKSVPLNVGNNIVDIYESMQEVFTHDDVNNVVNITIPSKQSIIISIVPSSAIITFEKNKTLADGIVIDYMQTKVGYNHDPRIKSLAPFRETVEINDTTKVFCTAMDLDSPNLEYKWSSNNGTIIGTGSDVIFKADGNIGTSTIKVIVKDNEGNVDSNVINIDVVNKINKAPVLNSLSGDKKYIATSEVLQINCDAIDDEAITYEWTSSGGQITGEGDKVTFISGVEGVFSVTVKVQDTGGLTSTRSISILVYNFQESMGTTIADYPFSGNANDVSGNDLNGTPKGAILTADRNNKSNSAYYFNGDTQHIAIGNDDKLNFDKECTINFWFKLNGLPTKELFLISHGSWQNRYKVSITPEKHIRWTINTDMGIKDLDSDIIVNADSTYNCIVTFDGDLMCIYINGVLNSYSLHKGLLKKTNLNLLIGQMLPNDAEYNFKGVIDDIKIFNKSYIPVEVQNLFNGTSATKDEYYTQFTISPNPTSGILNISIQDNISGDGILEFYDNAGRLKKTIKIYDKNTIVDISEFNSGMYFIKIKDKKKVIGTTFLKL